jgi:hypothetical protein
MHASRLAAEDRKYAIPQKMIKTSYDMLSEVSTTYCGTIEAKGPDGHERDSFWSLKRPSSKCESDGRDSFCKGQEFERRAFHSSESEEDRRSFIDTERIDNEIDKFETLRRVVATTSEKDGRDEDKTGEVDLLLETPREPERPTGHPPKGWKPYCLRDRRKLRPLARRSSV